MSLGVNLMPTTGKICTFDCLYCEDGFNAERRTPRLPLPGVVPGGDGAWPLCRKLRKAHDSYGHKMRAPNVRGTALPGLAFAGPGNFH